MVWRVKKGMRRVTLLAGEFLKTSACVGGGSGGVGQQRVVHSRGEYSGRYAQRCGQWFVGMTRCVWLRPCGLWFSFVGIGSVSPSGLLAGPRFAHVSFPLQLQDSLIIPLQRRHHPLRLILHIFECVSPKCLCRHKLMRLPPIQAMEQGRQDRVLV